MVGCVYGNGQPMIDFIMTVGFGIFLVSAAVALSKID
jgi:hypothetical protein